MIYFKDCLPINVLYFEGIICTLDTALYIIHYMLFTLLLIRNTDIILSLVHFHSISFFLPLLPSSLSLTLFLLSHTTLLGPSLCLYLSQFLFSPSEHSLPSSLYLSLYLPSLSTVSISQDIHRGADKWGKPHVATLKLQSIINLRKCIARGTVLLGMKAFDLESVVGMYCNKYCRYFRT